MAWDVLRDDYQLRFQTESWQVNAGDPLALTQLLNLPNMIVTHMEYDA